MKDKQAMAFRLSDKARYFLRIMSEEDGVGMTAFLENILRAIAKERGVVFDDDKENK